MEGLLSTYRFGYVFSLYFLVDTKLVGYSGKFFLGISLMMADSLHELYQKLSLTEQEKEAICVDLLRLGDTNE